MDLSLVKIHWRMLILECSQGCYMVKDLPSDLHLWPWKSIGFHILLMTMYVPSLVKIHWRMLILECSQGCYAVKIWCGDLDLWPWKSIGFHIILRTKYVPSLVGEYGTLLIFKVKGEGHWVNFLPCNILVNTLESTSFNGFWPNLVHT
jgi:hypothetical protein